MQSHPTPMRPRPKLASPRTSRTFVAASLTAALISLGTSPSALAAQAPEGSSRDRPYAAPAEHVSRVSDADASSKPANVKSYGAKGDGVTDETRRIQAALDSKHDVYLPAGVYVVRGTLEARYPDQRIYGKGTLAFPADGVRTDSEVRIFHVTAPRVTFDGLTFEGQAVASYSVVPRHDWFIVFDHGSDGGRVIGSTFQRMARPRGHLAAAVGVLAGVADVQVLGNTIRDSAGGGIFLQGARGRAIGNTIRSVRDVGIAINSTDAVGAVVSGNTITDADPQAAIAVEEGAYNWSITKNTITGSQRALLLMHLFYNGPAMGGGTFANNAINDLRRNPANGALDNYGVHISSDKYRSVVIEGNRFTGLSRVTPGTAFVYVQANTNRLKLVNNVFEANSAVFGVIVASGSHVEFVMERNVVRGMSSTTKLAAGAWLQSLPFSNGVVSGNTFEHIANQAIKVDGPGWRGRMSKNRFIECGMGIGPYSP